MNRNNFNNSNHYYNHQQQSIGRSQFNNNNPNNFYHLHQSQSLNNFSRQTTHPTNFNSNNIPPQMGPPPSFQSQNQMNMNQYQPFMNQPPVFNQSHYLSTSSVSNNFKNSSSSPNINNTFSQNKRFNNQNNETNYRNNYNRYNQRNFNNNNNNEPMRSHYRDSPSYSSNRYYNNNNRNRDESESDYNRKSERSQNQHNQSKPAHLLYKQEADYTQTTSIPIYYTKHANKLTTGTSKLDELCDRFKHDIIERSRRARERENLPPESTKIPDYRQLIQTKKFDKFTRCTCDQPNHNPSPTRKSCKKHKRSDSSSSSDSSTTTCSSLSSSSCSSRSSSRDENKKDKEDSDDEFDDIRSMEINRKQNHPERLHPDLSFNEPDQTNEGPLCKCKLKNTTFGTRHQIYYGEASIEPCDEKSNNSDRLFHYRMNITPFDNFIVSKIKLIFQIKLFHSKFFIYLV
jgi:ribonuclease-3